MAARQVFNRNLLLLRNIASSLFGGHRWGWHSTATRLLHGLRAQPQQSRFFGISSSQLKHKATDETEEDNTVVSGPDAPKPLQETRDASTGTRKVVLPPLSKQQEQARQILLEGRQNIVINACAGSGKTTTLLQMAANIPKRFLALLYNRRLRVETIERAQSLGLDNLYIDNYHGLAYRYYSREADTDQGLKRIVEDDMPPLEPLPEFDVLVLDEQQDMNPIIYNFVLKLLRDSAKTGTNSPQLMLLGDPRQEIYQFNNADKRFLTHCRDLFPGQYIKNSKVQDRTWVEINQMVSFRMTSQIARFINHQLLRGSKPPIGTIKDNPKDPLPRYVVCDAFSDEPLKELKRLLKMPEIKPEDILILAPSLRSARSPIRDLANLIATKMPEIRIHIPTDDDDRITDKVGAGKIIFASYHQAKGIEREAAILFNFSSSYYDFYDRNPATLLNVGNVQYVAATRAKKHLVLIHHHEDDYLPFINKKTLSKYCYRPPGKNVKPYRTEKELKQIKQPKYRWKVTDLTRNIPETVISECFEELDLEMVRRPNKYRVWPETEIEINEGNWQAVADITGTAVPAIFEYQHRGTCKLVTDIMNDLEKLTKPLELLPEKYREHMLDINDRLEEQQLRISDVLFMANISNMLQSGYIYKVLTIPLDNYTWFTGDHSDAAFNILNKMISGEARYEIFVGHKFVDVKAGENGVSVIGRVDLFDYARMWELKWTSALRPEHVLQVALYAAIGKRTTIKRFREQEYLEKEPPAIEDDTKKRKTKKKIKIEIDYRDIENEELQTKLKRKTSYLLHIPTGQRIKIGSIITGKRDGYIEVLRKLVEAKINPPRLAISDKKFLAEAKLGFPSLVGRCTVPPWLSSSWVKESNEAKKRNTTMK
ncbi:hypothetical protein H072_4845 [Dactylellina haptotyla CBS 200.50]|uniref:UvrD-like helicase ATP-binding domain-containing protein n=1 Tax=Dactylellina haptotyla (strain CBS 200.50) TaxID=1284197 RepID=S8AJB3_DACHA|nr:hypothetical protein H072_4845 [Dactylellina haptotyla CBS 200.50]